MSSFRLNQTGLSSMVILIVTVLAVVISWELAVYVDKFILTGQDSKPAAKRCVGGSDPRDCDDTFEGADVPIDLSGGAPLCKSGNQNDCNDSGDVFLFIE